MSLVITVPVETLRTALQPKRGFDHGEASWGRKVARCNGCGAEVHDTEEQSLYDVVHKPDCPDRLRKEATETLLGLLYQQK